MKKKLVSVDCVAPSLAGRLGNNMFMIANAYAQALRQNKQLVIPYHQVDQIEKFVGNIFRKLDLYIDYIDDINSSTATITSGHFESEEYFSEFSEAIKQLFSPTLAFLDVAHERFPFLGKTEVTCICVRRGDYLALPNYHPTVTVEYINAALKIIPKTKNILVFSDDIPWCKEHLTLPNTHFVENTPVHEQMWFMSLCDYFVTSNSTFSWWGAYLSRSVVKRVVAPQTWFGPDGPSNWQSIYCKDWTVLPTNFRGGRIYPKNEQSTFGISVLTLTYGRLELLQEAIYSFLQQHTHTDTEMVVINDDVNVKYRYDHPRVRIINHAERFTSISKKIEWGYKQCKYDYIYRLDDDDLLAPWGLQNATDDILQMSGYDVYRGSGIYLFTDNQYDGVASNTNNGNVYTKSYLDGITFPDANFGEDYNITFQQGARIYESKRKPTMIYRWGMKTYHVSGMGDIDVDDSFARVDSAVSNKANGVVELQPQFFGDYYSRIVPTMQLDNTIIDNNHSLVIVSATYDTLDVTTIVKSKIEAGDLALKICNQLFGDPAPFNKKQFKLQYTVNGVAAEKILSEHSTLHICRMRMSVIILSNSTSSQLIETTRNTIRSCINTDVVVFEFIVIEQNPDVSYNDMPNTKTYYKEGEFNYNRFMNYGVSLAQYEYIAMCNNDLIFDDLWASNIITTMINVNVLSACPQEPNMYNMDEEIMYGYDINKHIAGWCIVVHREIFSIIGSLDVYCEFWYSDNMYANQIKKVGVPHILVKSAKCRHLNGGGNTVRTLSSDIQTQLTYNMTEKYDQYLKITN